MDFSKACDKAVSDRDESVVKIDSKDDLTILFFTPKNTDQHVSTADLLMPLCGRKALEEEIARVWRFHKEYTL